MELKFQFVYSYIAEESPPTIYFIASPHYYSYLMAWFIFSTLSSLKAANRYPTNAGSYIFMYFGPKPFKSLPIHRMAYFLTSPDLSLKLALSTTWMCSKWLAALWVIKSCPTVCKVPFLTLECWWLKLTASDLIMFNECWPIESLNFSHNTLIRLFDAYIIENHTCLISA